MAHSSVLHIQHLLQNNVKNNRFTSGRQMATKSFSVFLYLVKLRLLSSIYIHCDIKTLEILEIIVVRKLLEFNIASEIKLTFGTETMSGLLLRCQWHSIAQKLNSKARLKLLWGPFCRVGTEEDKPSGDTAVWMLHPIFPNSSPP